MITVLIGQRGRLIRAAMTSLLSTKPDIAVVGDVANHEDVVRLAMSKAVDVAMLDEKIVGDIGADDIGKRLLPSTSLLVVSDLESPMTSLTALAPFIPRVGFVGMESSPETLIDSVRRLARGEPVFDQNLTLAAFNSSYNPLTDRELKILRLAAQGLRSLDIARELYISNGTVRNHLSRILTKTDTRTRIAAIRLAQERGWI